jgi:hypothetical protein
MRIVCGLGESPRAEPTITDASKANKVRFTEPLLYQFVVAVWRAKEAKFDLREGLGIYARSLGSSVNVTCVG